MDCKRTMAIAGILSLLAGIAPAAMAFSDVRSGITPYSRAIEALRERGVVEGYDDGSFKPTSTINRAEFLKIVLESRDGTYEGSDCFPDVGGEWFAKYVCTAKDEGIIQGYPDGTFRPEQNINFVEASKIMALAFGQEMNEYSPDWYEPFVRALESSKAIPLSVEKLEQQVDRGEMAEMMWRLTEEVNDQPSKGYLNVKYPDVNINMASTEPQRAQSCRDLKAFTEEASRTMGYDGDMMMLKNTIAPMASPMAAEADSGASRTADFSDTNVQVAGVDEADMVKTDGTYIYMIENNAIRIVKAQPAKDLSLVGTIAAEDVFQPSSLYLDDDRLVVTGTSWGFPGEVRIMNEKAASMIWPGPSNQRTHVRIYNVSDRKKPVLERTVSFDGSIASSRRIGSKMYLVLNQPVQWYGPRPVPVPLEGDLLPKFQDSASGSVDQPVARCGEVVILPQEPSPQYLTVAVIPTDGSNAAIQKEVILGSAENIYASPDNLFIASTQWQYSWRPGSTESQEKTRIYRFAFTDTGVEMKAQGSVPGRILNQFSMDEHDDHFRIATTKGQSWDTSDPSKNNIYILGMNLERTGAIEDIAPGETIYSARFMGDRAYLVTFKKVDPFFVLDLSNPADPRILGKLKIPGYSDYLHPYDETHIIGFGKDAEVAKEGDFAWYQGMKMAIFDVTNPDSPKEMHSFGIGDRGTDSPLLHDHHALLFDRERNLLAFPVTVHEVSEAEKAANPSAWGVPVFQGAYVFDIDLQSGFRSRGTISHYDNQDYLKSGSYLYGKDIQRILRLNNSLVTISQKGVQSHTEETVELEKAITFENVTASCSDDDPSRSYVSHDPEECKLVDFACADNEVGFSDECGCGCEK